MYESFVAADFAAWREVHQLPLAAVGALVVRPGTGDLAGTVVTLTTLHGAGEDACGLGDDAELPLGDLLADLAGRRGHHMVTFCELCLANDAELGPLHRAAETLSVCWSAAAHASSVADALDRVQAGVEAAALTVSAAASLVALRRYLEMPEELGGLPPLHPTVQDPTGLLGDWWPRRYEQWCTRTASARESLRTAELAGDLVHWHGRTGDTVVLDYDGPLQLLVPAGRLPVNHDGQPIQWLTPTRAAAQLIACSDVAGYVPWPEPAPAFAAPSGWSATEGWVNLGPVPPGGALPALLAGYASLTRDRTITAEAIAALRTSLDLPA